MQTTIAKMLPVEQLRTFCKRWRISRLELFGSALRNDFRTDSDIDLLVSFQPDARWGLLEHVRMQQELSELLDRPVDLVSRRAVETSDNPLRRQRILETAQLLVEAEPE